MGVDNSERRAAMSGAIPRQLGLRAGEWVFVRSREEILGTLDQHGRLEGLLFQPEMFAHCGMRLRVFKVAHKTCDTVSKTGGRRMKRTVHLERVRCDGSCHGHCQADCLLFWKEAWLKRADDRVEAGVSQPIVGASLRQAEEAVRKATRVAGTESQADPTWQCQATTLLQATEPLKWWDVRQYWSDVSSGNHSAGRIGGLLLGAAYRRLIQFGYAYRALILFYNIVQKLRGGQPFAIVAGRIPRSEPTPVEALDLQPGEWVEVKSLEEIRQTLHQGTNQNRGMMFDKEALAFCGKRFLVKARIDRIIDERSGRMIPMKTPCIELHGAYCQAVCSEKRIGCPRAIPSYWREIWLRRVASTS